MSVSDELRNLQALHTQGVLSDAEFEQEKARVLRASEEPVPQSQASTFLTPAGGPSASASPGPGDAHAVAGVPQISPQARASGFTSGTAPVAGTPAGPMGAQQGPAPGRTTRGHDGNRRRWTTLGMVGGIAVASAAALALVLSVAGVIGGDSGLARAASSTQTAPSGGARAPEAPGTADDSPAPAAPSAADDSRAPAATDPGVQPGDCYDSPFGDTRFTADARVPCTEPHTAEVVSFIDNTTDDKAVVTEQCASDVDEYLGYAGAQARVAAHRFEPTVRPAPSGWHCGAYAFADEDEATLAELQTSVRGYVADQPPMEWAYCEQFDSDYETVDAGACQQESGWHVLLVKAPLDDEPFPGEKEAEEFAIQYCQRLMDERGWEEWVYSYAGTAGQWSDYRAECWGPVTSWSRA
jgi:hypothetical protein